MDKLKTFEGDFKIQIEVDSEEDAREELERIRTFIYDNVGVHAVYLFGVSYLGKY